MLNGKIEFDNERVERFSKIKFMFHIDFGMAPMFLAFHVQLSPQQCSYLSKQKQESETKLVILIITLGIIAFTFI